jgi:hypothetical protein
LNSCQSKTPETGQGLQHPAAVPCTYIDKLLPLQARRRVYRAILPAYTGPNAQQQQQQQQPQQQQQQPPDKAPKKRSRTAAAAAAAGTGERLSKVSKTGSGGTAAEAAGQKARVVPVLEAPPKWDLLLQLLQEVEQQRGALRAAADAAVVVEEGVQDGNTDQQQQQQQEQQQEQQEQQEEQEQQQQQQQEQGAGIDVVDLLSSSDEEEAPNQQQQQQPLRLSAAAVAALRGLSNAPLLVVCKELHSQQQLQQVVQLGPEAVMQQLYSEYLRSHLAATAGAGGAGGQGQGGVGRGRGRRGGGSSSSSSRGRGRGRGRGRSFGAAAAAAGGPSGGAGGGVGGRGSRGRGSALNARRWVASNWCPPGVLALCVLLLASVGCLLNTALALKSGLKHAGQHCCAAASVSVDSLLSTCCHPDPRPKQVKKGCRRGCCRS